VARITQGPASHRVARCSECGAKNAVPRNFVGKVRCSGGCGASVRPVRPSATPAVRDLNAADVPRKKGRVVIAERPNRRRLVLPRA
jgi:hypothetical protein